MAPRMIWGRDPTPHQIANNLIMMMGLANAVSLADLRGMKSSSAFGAKMPGVGATMTVLAWLTGQGVPSSVVDLLRDAVFANGVLAIVAQMASEIGGYRRRGWIQFEEGVR